MYHYVYRVVCPKTKLYYIGLHSTSNLDDGYEGSGLWPINYIRKHGKSVLEKHILSFHETRELAAKVESELVTFDLIEQDSKCMNLTPGGSGFSPEQWSKINKGRTKENDAGRRSMAEKLTGRTKETHTHLALAGQKVSKALTGRTKDTHQYIANVAKLFASRNKQNHLGVAEQSKKFQVVQKRLMLELKLNLKKCLAVLQTHHQVLSFELKNVEKYQPTKTCSCTCIVKAVYC